MTITPEALAAGHYYDALRTNSPCQQCADDYYEKTGETVLFLTCRHDVDDWDPDACEHPHIDTVWHPGHCWDCGKLIDPTLATNTTIERS